MSQYDYLIVGAGFAGSVMARQLADAGKRVLIIDKRDHIGGNAYDYVNEHGVRIHKYGPHIFHTNSDRVFAYLSRFTAWRHYEHRVLASVDGKLVPFPINLDTINSVFGLDLNEGQAAAWLESQREDIPNPQNAEEQCLSVMGSALYEKFFKGYTTKFWGRTPSELDKSVTARIPVRINRDDRYFTDKHQFMPKDGYAKLFERMLDHPGIELHLSEAFGEEHRRRDMTIWTGAIDDFFSWRFGPLPYRSLEFIQSHHTGPSLIDAATINDPRHDGATRTTTRMTDMRRLTGVGGDWTTLVSEHPRTEGDPYYPIPSPESASLYAKYEALARERSDVIFLGRLGRYQYLNMDQAVGQALATFERMKLEQAA